jgi:nucleotide-binding universal stress UspA family protein
MATPQVGKRQRRIVVGVDGSASSKAALAWAVEQVGLTRGRGRGYRLGDPMVPRTPWSAGLATDFEESAANRVADAIAEVSGSAGQVEIRSKVVEGNAAQVLLDASAGADLLVVVSRGHGGFVGAVLGSVSQHRVHHSSAPVVVIRDSVAAGR